MSKLDRLAHKEFKKNIEAKKILLYAKHDGVAGVSHQFTLREEYKFAYTTFAFGNSTYYVGDWTRVNNSDTISLNYYLGHGFKEYLPLILLKSEDNDNKYIEFISSDSIKASNSLQFEVTYIENQILK